MAHDDGLNTLVSEGSDLYVALLCVRDCEHAASFTVEGAESIWVITCVEAVDERKVGKVVHVCFDGQDDHNAKQK